MHDMICKKRHLSRLSEKPSFKFHNEQVWSWPGRTEEL